MIYHGSMEGLADLAEFVNKAALNLGCHLSEFDRIVATGMSGVVVAVPVALALDVPIGILRKTDDESHHSCGRWIGAPNMGERCLFLDDFVSEGATRRSVTDAVALCDATVTAQYLYRDGSFLDRR